MIGYLQIEHKLRSISNNIPIKIKRWGDVLTVYLTQVKNDTIWARHYNEVQDTRIFPTQHVRILKIGSEEVQTKESYLEEFKIYKEYMKLKKHEEYKMLYRGAIRHQYELGTGEPIK